MHTGFEDISNWNDVAGRWRTLHEAAGAGFFRSWEFLGCDAAARFSAPVLLSITEDGNDLGLALLNRRDGKLHLNTTGDTALDAVYIEHNGLLLRPDAPASLAAAMAALASRGPVVMAGVDAASFAAAGSAGLVLGHQAQFAPAIPLASLEGDYLDSLSANARGQIRRAIRLCRAAPALAQAGEVTEALAWFDAMVALHQASWQARGKPGAFATEKMIAFHQALLRRAVPSGAAAMLRISAGSEVLGYLYMLLGAGVVHAYQSGFATPADARHKPGLICHALAVEHFRANGFARYDLMAKPDRYKMTLAPHGGEQLHWFTLYPPGSWQGRAKLAAQRLKPRLKAALAWRKGGA